NKNLDFSKSQHFVLGYDYFATKYLKLKAQIYYQQLWNVPVYFVPSSVSMLNVGATFLRFIPIYQMENRGRGQNYGLELTVEKLYHKHFFFMFSGSFYESKYKATYSNAWLNTNFNGNYMFNLLGGYEINLGNDKKDNLSFG